MEQIPPWDANRSSASQEIPQFYGTRRFIPVFTTTRHIPLSSDRAVLSMHTSYILKNNFNIILWSTPGSCKWSPSLRSSDQNPECTSLLTRVTRLVSLLLLTYLETGILKNLSSWEETLEPEDYYSLYNHVPPTLMFIVPSILYLIDMIASVLTSLRMSGAIPPLPSISLFGTLCLCLKNQIINNVWISWWIFVTPDPNITHSVNVWLLCFSLSLKN
jgi:hypothetical protein